jgi:type I restriction enzyme S subunit
MACCNVVRLSEVRSGFRIDSEFYRADFVELDHELSKLPLKTIGVCASVTDGEHGSVRLTTSGVKYLTAENVRQGYVDVEKVRYVGSDVDDRNARARVRCGDVLVSIKGTLGEIGLAEKEILPANMNRDVAIIKPHSHINGGYLTAFLRSRFGVYQLAREGSGGVQQMITLGRLRTVQVVLLPQDQQGEVAQLQSKETLIYSPQWGASGPKREAGPKNVSVL